MAKVKSQKVTKIKLTEMQKSHANLQTMIKEHAQFQTDQHKTVRGLGT